MTAPSSAPTSTARTVRQLSHRETPTLRNRSSSIRKAASFIGATARACASCAAISTARGWRRSSRRGAAKPIAGISRLFRANVEIPAGQTAANRSDIEIFYDALPEPIDLELDHKNRILYWTDRGDPPRGNTVNRASIDNKPAEPEIVVTHLMEGIGIALDIPNDRMFVTDFAGSIYSARLDGSGERNFLFAQGNLTGIAYAEI